MSVTYLVYTEDESRPSIVTRDPVEAIAAFTAAVASGEFEAVRLDYSS